MNKVLILGASGMLGNAMLRVFSTAPRFTVVATVRSKKNIDLLPAHLRAYLIPGIDVENSDILISLLSTVRPRIVINCIGLVKQLVDVEDPLLALPINSIFPHRLARLCGAVGARLIHMSTDCVFSGGKGMYTEEDFADADDLYGRSKFLGEVDYPNAITLRTSIIGHELEGARSLINWFVSQHGQVKGFRRAIFSGLPTVEIATLIRDYVIPRPALRGVYNVSAEPISKFELLSLVARTYGKDIEIVPDDDFVIDRSLDSSRFRHKTGYVPAPWGQLIQRMHDFG